MKRCLVVVDMQNDFITGSLGTEQAQDIVKRTADKIKKFPGTVLYTRDTHGEDYRNTREGKKLPVEHCVKGTQGWNLHPEIEVLYRESGSRMFDKPVFGSIALMNFLLEENKKEAIEEAELVGLCTDVCVISNAMLLRAALPEAEISVDASCCAGVTIESHQTALSAMEMCQIMVKNKST